jgi:2-methylcitrate dehydratase PrpD
VTGASPSLTTEAAAFVSTLTFAALPPEVLRLARRCVLDGVAVSLAGSDHEALAVVRRHLRRVGGNGHARLLGDAATRVPVHLAALWHGVAGHVLDWDDTQLSEGPGRVYGQLTHPTVPALAACLATSDYVGGVDGATFLTAFVAAFEVECKLAEAIDPSHYLGGFHTSGTMGTFGAAAAAARILELDAGHTARALGIAASMASGIRANFGTMTKALHVGRAAENGVTAALLAAEGYTADTQALDGRWGYLRVAANSAGDPAAVQGRLGRPFSIVDPGVSVKPYACGVLTHPSMDALLTLLRGEGLDASGIVRIRLHAADNVLAPIRYSRATDELQAKFCFPFLLAAIAIAGRAGRDEFTPAFVRRADVQAMQERVELVHDAGIEALGFDRIRSKVVVETADGRTLERWADDRYRGGPERPLSDEELEGKLAEAVSGLLPPERLTGIASFVWELEGQADVTPLLELLDWGRP